MFVSVGLTNNLRFSSQQAVVTSGICVDPPYLVTVVLYRYDSKGKWYGSHCFTMEEAPAQICTISGMVAALRNHVELWPKQTAKFSFMDERGIMVPITCDSQLIGFEQPPCPRIEERLPVAAASTSST